MSRINHDVSQSMSYGKHIVCPWCGGDEITSRTVTDLCGEDGSRTMKDLCRCADCGRTFSVAKNPT